MENTILKNIETNWKLEAKLEDTEKYFYHSDDARAIIRDGKCYVIGRKGSGKSAICEHLVRRNEHNVFTTKLNFKNFPFNELYHLDNQKYTQPNQYITLWKYLIYSHICRLMVTNESIDSDVRLELEKLYPKNDVRTLARTISKWTSAEFGATILGTGGALKIARENSTNQTPWIDKVNILEDIIFEYCDESAYYIVFDELDEDYRSVKTRNRLNNMFFYLPAYLRQFKILKQLSLIVERKSNQLFF